MVKNKFLVSILGLFIFASLLGFVSAAPFEFNGTARDENGIPLNNSIVNVTVRNMAGWTVVGYNSTTTNASGWFNLSVGDTDQVTWVYEPIIIHYNSTLNFADYRSKTIPAFPSQMIQQLAGTTFYLAPAGTINITLVNSSGGRDYFRYQIKDTKLGYPIAENFNSLVNEAVVYVPSNRNYSIMIYPNQSMPLSFNWNNFSSSATDNFGISSYNSTSKTVHKKFNNTMSMPSISGYINHGSITGWDELAIIPYLLEPGNMVHSEFGDMPYNLSSAIGATDVFNLTSGFYNISLPATVENSNILLFATARNGSLYFGGFRNISLSYNGASILQFNFSLSGLLGIANNITMDRVDGNGLSINISTARQSFRLFNSSNVTLGNVSAHIKTKVDYSQLGAIEFTWMTDIAQSTSVSTFAIPLLNSTGIKEMNLFVSGSAGGGNQFAPKRISKTVSEIIANSNLTIGNFNPGAINASVAAGSISIALYYSNSTCDVPSPSSTCLIGGSQTMATFNPMRAVMGGGKISFRMGTGNIFVHYVNVDLIASGPPDALFDSSTTGANSGSSFAAALRLGSSGPTIYDYVLVSIPYSETAGSGLNDSAQVNISIPILYDDNWNIIWNVTANGTAGAALAGNISHYSTYQNDWAILMNQSICTTNAISSSSAINSSKPCYINTSNNMMWIRLPHFSGAGPSISGSVLSSTLSNDTTSSSSSGTESGDISYWKSTFSINNQQFITNGYTRELQVRQRIKFRVNESNVDHYAGLVALTDNAATINVSSKPQQAAISIGDVAKFELTNDSFYDLSITLNGIANSKANITMRTIHEEIPVTLPTPEIGSNLTASGQPTLEEEGTGLISAAAVKSIFKSVWFWIITALILACVGIIVYQYYLKQRYYHKGYGKKWA